MIGLGFRCVPRLLGPVRGLSGGKSKAGKVIAEDLDQALSVLESNTVTNLQYTFKGLDPSGAQTLAKAVESNTSLVELTLGANKVGPTGAEAIAKAAVKHPSLKLLALGGNSIGNAGAEAVFDILATAPKLPLRTLNLVNNGIGPELPPSLLRLQITLDWLTLANNAIVHVPPELAHMENLREIKFDMNPLRADLLEAYDKGLVVDDKKLVLWDGLREHLKRLQA